MEGSVDPLAGLAPTPRATATDANVEPPYRVLIVEDDPSQALFAESVINAAGMEALSVSVPSEVIATMGSFRPDLVLMDLHMPGIDGVELTSTIRGHAEHGATSIVFLTGDPDPERHFEVLDVGADDFLTKPVRPRHLVTVVENRIRRTRALQASQRSTTVERHPTTGLHTRQQMLQLLGDAIAQKQAGGLFFIEIDGTAALRERYGYASLESVLSEAGRQLGTLAGASPASRLNDNTFLVFEADLAAEDLALRARGLRDGLGRQSFVAGQQLLRLRARVGYVSVAQGFDDAGEALWAAEQALRDARDAPLGVAEWRPDPASGRQDAALVGLVRDALQGDGFELAFQPIVAVAGGEEAQFQALARMRDDDGRLYTASEFLPLADAAGLLYDIDRRVLDLAIATLARKRDEGRTLRLFVAQSARSLGHTQHAEKILAALSSTGLDGASLVIDIRQEDAEIHALSLHEFCRTMVAAGVQLCMSQYRPGDEARSLLPQLPLGFVRLSARYSSGLDDEQVRDEMREAIEYAHRLGLQVVGPQVEDPQAAATLWMSGVDFIQGNLVQQAADALDFDFQHSVL